MNVHAWGATLVLLNPQAQGPETPLDSQPPSKWVTDVRVRGDVRYNNNVWLLDGTLQARLAANQPSDLASARYQDMERVADLIPTPDVRFQLAGPSPFGRRMNVWINAEYAAYMENPRRRNLEASLGAGQYVGPDGHLDLALRFVPEYFERNYLADAVDVNGDASISADERRYTGATYRDWDLGLEYRQRIVDRKRRQPLGLVGVLTAGYRERGYDSPFQSHDGKGPWTQAALRFEYGPGLRWGVRYRYEIIDSPTGGEVMILDEPDFGVDFNGNGTTTDVNARAFENADRSRREREIGLALGFNLLPRVQVDIPYTLTLRDYTSSEPFNVAHRDRKDHRHDVGVSLRYAVRTGWGFRLGYEWRRHDTDRPADPDLTDDTFDYTRHVLFLTLGYRW